MPRFLKKWVSLVPAAMPVMFQKSCNSSEEIQRDANSGAGGGLAAELQVKRPPLAGGGRLVAQRADQCAGAGGGGSEFQVSRTMGHFPLARR